MHRLASSSQGGSSWGRAEEMVLFVCGQTGQWARALRMLRRRVAEGGAQVRQAPGGGQGAGRSEQGGGKGRFDECKASSWIP